MGKAKILIVEDEPLIADDIADILEQQGYEIVGVVDEAIDALAIVARKQPDLALLDINIVGDMDGIELATKLAIPFIFLTSYYDKKTLNRAKETNPSGYIVKPFNARDLLVNVEIALARQFKMQRANEEPKKLFLKNGNEIVSVQSSEIIYVEAFDNYATVFLENDKFVISHTLKSVEEKLCRLGFIRVHRSSLINFNAIDSISENYVFLKGHKVLVSKSYRKELLNLLTII